MKPTWRVTAKNGAVKDYTNFDEAWEAFKVGHSMVRLDVKPYKLTEEQKALWDSFGFK